MMAAMSVFTRLSQSSIAARSAAQATTIAAVGFMTAYDPQAMEQFYASRDPQTIASRELSGAESIIWDAVWEDVRRLENAGNAQPLLRRGELPEKTNHVSLPTKPGRTIQSSPNASISRLVV
jgi:hypothetical protein